MKVGSVVVVLFLLTSNATYTARAGKCDTLMASLAKASDSTVVYVGLLRNLALEKGAFSAESLGHMLGQKDLAQPLEYTSRSLDEPEKFAFLRGFDSLRGVDWIKARRELIILKEELKKKISG